MADATADVKQAKSLVEEPHRKYSDLRVYVVDGRNAIFAQEVSDGS